MAFQVLLMCLVGTIVFVCIVGRKQKKIRLLPPSPKALPIIGHLHLFSPIPHQDFYKLSLRYGPIMSLSLGSVPCVVASTAEAAKEFLKTHEDSFSNRPSRTVVIETLTYGLQDFLFAPYGPSWKFMKKLCMSELFCGRMLDQFLPVRRHESKRFVQRLLQKGMASEAVNFEAELMTLSNNIVTGMTVSQTSENDNQAQEMRKLVSDVAQLLGKFNVSDCIWFLKHFDLQGFNKKVMETRHRFDAVLDRIIHQRQAERAANIKQTPPTRPFKDMLDVLLDILQDDTSQMKLNKENIKAFIMDIFVAGTDTSAATIEWAMAELINNPDVLEKARQEIDVVVGKSRMVEESDIVNLPYLQAIVKETFRLHPAGPLVVRESSKSAKVCGYDIPAKTRLFVNVWAIGRDPNHWKNPFEFRPERFMENGKSQLDVRGQNYHFLPFGSGRRMCPGTSLGLQVVHLNLAVMIQCFQWKVDSGNSKVDMEEKSGITLPRAHPIICVPIPRLDPFPAM